MANRVIKLENSSNSDKKSEDLEVFRDISMVSDRRKSYFVEFDDDGKPTNVSKDGYWVSKDVNVKAVFNSIRNIFSWIPGERIINPEFGSRLRLYLYEGITAANKEKIISEIRTTCLRWEPRVNIVSIRPSVNPQLDEDNTVQIDIVFSIPSLSDKQYQYSYIFDRTK